MKKINDRLYSWASILEDQAQAQAERSARLTDPQGNPLIAGHVALMPDAHWGMGATVGSVIPTENAIIPAAVGVDIGCGMVATRTSLTANDLPDSLDGYLGQATRDVPAGVGQGHATPTAAAVTWFLHNPPPSQLSEQESQRAISQFGSLGSGNHFYEVSLDEEDQVWLVLHSGSRGIGNRLAMRHIERARSDINDAGIALEDPDLAYLMQGTPPFERYIADMRWSQDYAYANRRAMVDAALRGFFGWVGAGEVVQTINCHHNFTEREVHGGRDLWITRKGAISARSGELGIIPGSMGARSYVVEGLGNPLSWQSCSHGAGRLMSRNQAVKSISAAELRTAMAGKAWQEQDAEYLVDESPMAYKPIDQVMEDQKDLVRVVHELRQIFNYKGVERGKRSKSRK